MNTLQGLRERGAEAFDPVRWRFIEALDRRAQAVQGAARQQLDTRLQALLHDYAAAFEQAQCTMPPVAPARSANPSPGALQALNQHIARHGAPAGSELQTLQWARRTWSRISVGRRMVQSLANKPEKAGPINSHGLVLRALQQLGAVSPDYLDRFVAYADALLELDQACGGSALPQRDVIHREANPANASAGPAPAARKTRAASRAAAPAQAAIRTAEQPAKASVRKR
jgi:Protein of unknown function (DUF2894)